MDKTFIIFDDYIINSYCPGLELIRVYADREKNGWPLVLEFGRKDECSKKASIIINRDGSRRMDAFNKISESCIHHPGVIDLRGTYVTPKDVEEEAYPQVDE